MSTPSSTDGHSERCESCRVEPGDDKGGVGRLFYSLSCPDWIGAPRAPRADVRPPCPHPSAGAAYTGRGPTVLRMIGWRGGRRATSSQPARRKTPGTPQIGRASWRERVCQYV